MGELYTLNDPLFRYGIVESSDSECFFDDNRKIMVVGGTASQLNMRDAPHLLRPTTDIDIISNMPTTKNQRKNWAKNLEERITNKGHLAKGGLSRYGSEVRFSNFKPDLIIHLDCFGPNFFSRHKQKIDGEYERAEMIEVNGKNLRCHSPIDVIINKIRRIKILEKNKIGLDSNQKYILSLLLDAQFDYVDTNKLEEDLKKIGGIRNQTVEDLGRYGYNQIIEEIDRYKITKDFYDIAGVIDSCRRDNKKIYSEEFKKFLSLALEE